MIKDIVKNFQLLCEKQGWTHKQAAEEIGCERSHITKIFSGVRNPSFKLLEKMEEKLKEYNFKR